ncbi:MAG TPA: hypothetical protein VF247_03255 [Candidatus Krumholzibacteria bacterium]
MHWKRILLAAVTLAASATPALAAGEGKFSALVFGDAYWMAANHDSIIEDMNGLWIRRVNLTYDHTFDETYSARVRIEALQPGDFSTPLTLQAFLKDAWIKWARSGHSALIGIQPSVGMPTVEDTWGYRAVEKIPFELQGLTTSRDGGIAAQGDFGASKTVGYHVLVGNGSHVNQETNTKKKVAGALRVRPIETVVLEAYGDYEDRMNSGDRVSYYGFAGYTGAGLRAGVQYAHQTRMETGEDVDISFVSGFVVKSITEKMSVLARVDRNMDPNPQGPSIQYMPFASVENTFFIAGLDFAVTEGVNFIPNAEITKYDDPDGPAEAPDTDVMLRLTFQGKF